MEEKRAKKGVEIAPSLHRRMKSISAAHGIPMWAAVEDAFVSWLDKLTGQDGEKSVERLQNLYGDDEKMVKLLHQIEQRDEMTAKSIRTLVQNLARIMGVEHDRNPTSYADASALTNRAIAGINQAIGAVEPSQASGRGGGGDRVEPDKSAAVRRIKGA